MANLSNASDDKDSEQTSSWLNEPENEESQGLVNKQTAHQAE